MMLVKFKTEMECMDVESGRLDITDQHAEALANPLGK